MKKKILALLLAVGMLLSLAACGTGETEEPADTSAPEDTSAPADTAAPTGLDYDAAYAAHAPEDVLFSVDGREVTWSEYFYTLSYVLNMLEYYGGISDWDAVCEIVGTGQTYREFVTEYTLAMCMQNAVINNRAEELGVNLTAEEIDAVWQENIAASGYTEEAFLEAIESQKLTKDVYLYITNTATLFDRLFVAEFGVNGADCTEADVLSYAEEHDYIMAKHILLSNKDDAGEALSEDDVAAKLARAEEILAEINASADKAAKFDQLMIANSEDPGFTYYPAGYIFTYGEMVEEFEETAFGMEPGEISDIVESTHGYHIIMRVELDPKATMDINSETGEAVTMQYFVAQKFFAEKYAAVVKDAAVEETEAYASMDLNDLFPAG